MADSLVQQQPLPPRRVVTVEAVATSKLPQNITLVEVELIVYVLHLHLTPPLSCLMRGCVESMLITR
jgi:hypothetical protein